MLNSGRNSRTLSGDWRKRCTELPLQRYFLVGDLLFSLVAAACAPSNLKFDWPLLPIDSIGGVRGHIDFGDAATERSTADGLHDSTAFRLGASSLEPPAAKRISARR